MKSLNAKTDISNLRYLRLKLLKDKENNKKICHIFHHNFKNIPCYVMSEISLLFLFALFDDGLTSKTLKLAFYRFLHSNSSYVSTKYTVYSHYFTSKLMIFDFPTIVILEASELFERLNKMISHDAQKKFLPTPFFFFLGGGVWAGLCKHCLMSKL